MNKTEEIQLANKHRLFFTSPVILELQFKTMSCLFKSSIRLAQNRVTYQVLVRWQGENVLPYNASKSTTTLRTIWQYLVKLENCAYLTIQVFGFRYVFLRNSYTCARRYIHDCSIVCNVKKLEIARMSFIGRWISKM